MTRFRPLLAPLLLVLLPLALGGCLFDHPLTSPTGLTSPNLDSRFAGVFEFREIKEKPGAKPGENAKPNDAKPGADAKPEDVTIHRLAVLPLGANHYVVYYRNFGKKPARTMKFLGWVSRVDTKYYFSFQDETDGEPSKGRYGFFRFVWRFPGDFTLYAPDAKEFESATSSYQMRKILRAKLKAETAFPYEGTAWKKIARVWWDPAGAGSGATIPPEFEKGTKLENPAF